MLYRLSVLALAAVLSLLAEAEPDPGLLKEIAAKGSAYQGQLDNYTYRQFFHFFEIDKGGTPRGDYLEVRDVLFNPEGERAEKFIKKPVNRLKRIRMTEEDFRDMREVQPFVITQDTLWLYETKYEGEVRLREIDCFVYRVKPRQVLEGQRLLDGRIWIDKETRQVVQAGGQPVPQIHRTEGSNLFARFLTIYEPIDGEFWFPVQTLADDTLPFSSGVQRVRYEIRYENYKRFSTDSAITFGEEILEQ